MKSCDSIEFTDLPHNKLLNKYSPILKSTIDSFNSKSHNYIMDSTLSFTDSSLLISNLSKYWKKTDLTISCFDYYSKIVFKNKKYYIILYELSISDDEFKKEPYQIEKALLGEFFCILNDYLVKGSDSQFGGYSKRFFSIIYDKSDSEAKSIALDLINIYDFYNFRPVNCPGARLSYP